MEYFILKPDGEQTGTFSIDQIRSMLNSGNLSPDARYWHEGISSWQPIDRIEESLNFPEPDPNEPHATPPPHKWTGSLARAIPSPLQQKLRSGPTALKSPAAKPELPAVPEPPRPSAAIPAASRPINFPSETTTPSPQKTFAPEPVSAEPFQPAEKPRRRWLPLPSAAQVSAAASTLLALAIIAAIVASRHPARSPLSRVTLSLHNNTVLTDQALIKPLEDDMHNAPVVDNLKRVIAQSKDPAFIQSATVGLQQEIEKHEIETTQVYLHLGRAEVIEPGTYSTVAYLDDNGTLVTPQPGEPWVAIMYKGGVAYAYLGNDFRLIPQ